MLTVERDADGAYTVLMLFPYATMLESLPRRLRELLTDPSRNRNVIRRLFPAAYKDPRKEAEYRHLLGAELFERKKEGIETFQRSLDAARLAEVSYDAGKGRVERAPALLVSFEAAEFELWLGFVNDVRLTLGVELDIQEDGWSADLEPKGPQADDWRLLHLLSFLEEELLRATGSP